MIVHCSQCKQDFQTKMAPCPDGQKSCDVAHYNYDSWFCPNCEHHMGAEVVKAIKEGPVTETVGIGVFNPAAVRKQLRLAQ